MQQIPSPTLNAPLLLTGATGTVGTQLVRILVSRHARIRILARELEKVHNLPPLNTRADILFFLGCYN